MQSQYKYKHCYNITMYNALLVGTGGFIGAVLRYLTGRLCNAYISSPLPIATLTVNIAGCFIMGIFAASEFKDHNAYKHLVAIGVLGGFTTFSAFGHDTFVLIKNEQFVFAALNVALNFGLCLAAVFLGAYAGTKLFS